MSAPSNRMLAFLQFLPVDAYCFNGEVGPEDRVMYSIATPGTPPASSADYGRVHARIGWRDQSWDKITVTFYLPPKGGAGAEFFCICVRASAWGRVAGPSWKSMILGGASMGVLEYPM